MAIAELAGQCSILNLSVAFRIPARNLVVLISFLSSKSTGHLQLKFLLKSHPAVFERNQRTLKGTVGLL